MVAQVRAKLMVTPLVIGSVFRSRTLRVLSKPAAATLATDE